LLQRESPRPGEHKRNAFEQNENEDHSSADGDPKLKMRNKGKAYVQKEQISGGQMNSEIKGNKFRSGWPRENQDPEQNDFRSGKTKSDKGKIISTHKL
jgi:hypothetical protein